MAGRPRRRSPAPGPRRARTRHRTPVSRQESRDRFLLRRRLSQHPRRRSRPTHGLSKCLLPHQRLQRPRRRAMANDEVIPMRSELLKSITRIVVKLGTGVLTDAKKQPDLAQLEQLVNQVAQQRAAGREVVLVSSGAVGAGMGVLGHAKRPAELAELQACAAVGQSRLMSTYEKLFAKHGLHVAQVLLTHADLEHHERHLNARNTLVRLLEHGIVPIINENDAVSFTEIKFGDNDKLSALVA